MVGGAEESGSDHQLVIKPFNVVSDEVWLRWLDFVLLRRGQITQ